ncbi:MAG: hypothetical protein ABSF29_11320, partial [Tepidisphaeraceae bacterium]
LHPGGRQDVWPLPDQAAGSPDFRPWLVTFGQDRLLLLNADGRIVRLKPDGDRAFAVEAIFDHGLGFLRSITRVWQDPAGRIDVAYSNNQLAIIFPTGRVDPQFADEILPKDLKRIDPR